jgi:hypothetical protein
MFESLKDMAMSADLQDHATHKAQVIETLFGPGPFPNFFVPESPVCYNPVTTLGLFWNLAMPARSFSLRFALAGAALSVAAAARANEIVLSPLGGGQDDRPAIQAALDSLNTPDKRGGASCISLAARTTSARPTFPRLRLPYPPARTR